MSTQTHSAPSWLFSFVDLAFLLLLAVTQIGDDARTRTVDLGQIAVPHIHAEAADDLPRDAGDRWQLRVHPPEEGVPPFELIGSGAAGERLALEGLDARLAELKRAGAEQPLLAPHADSRAQDLLEAVSRLEARWGRGRPATVAPEYAAR